MSDDLLDEVVRTSRLLTLAQAEVQRLAILRREQVVALRSRGVSYQEIADRIGVTRSAIQQLLR